MRLREHALAGGGGGDRGGQQLGQGGQLGVGAGDAHAVAGHDRRPTRAREGRGRVRNVRLAAVRPGREVAPGRVQCRPAVGSYRAAEGGAVVDHPHRAALAAERVLDGELSVLYRLHGVVRHGGVLGDRGERVARVERAVVAGAALIRRVLRIGRLVGQVGQQQHGRAAHVCLERAEQGVGEHEGALPDGYSRLAGEPAVHLGHHARELLVAHQHGANRLLAVVQGVVEPPHVAADDAEHHVDSGALKRAYDPDGRRSFCRQQRLSSCHTVYPTTNAP